MQGKLKKHMRTAALVVSLANGCWASLTQGDHGALLSPAIPAILSVWVGYFSLSWLIKGIRSR